MAQRTFNGCVLFVTICYSPSLQLSWSTAPRKVRSHQAAPSLTPRGPTVQGCALELASTEGVLLQQTTTDVHGLFHLKNLAPGDYTLVIPADHGFAAENLPIHIVGGYMPSLDVHLRLPEVNEKVDVADDSSDVTTNPGANSDQVTANAQLIEKIPVVNQDVISTFTPFLSQTGVNSKGVTLVVDGIETKSSGVSVSAIKSVSINNDPYTAEARSPGKGRIEILTKAGTPRFHGTFNFTFRDASTDAIPPFAIAPPVEQRRTYEGNISGPLSRGGKTTFLISGTRQEDNLQAIVNPEAILAAGLPGGVTNIDTPIHTTLFAVRVARDLAANHRVSLQYNVEDVITRNQGVGGLILGDTGVNTQSREDDIVINDSYTVSPNVVNQLQLFFEKDHNPVRSVVDAPKVIVDGTFTSGGAQADVLDTENNLKINEIVSWNKGHHFVKTGVVIPNLSRRAWEDHANRLGTFKFASLAEYDAQLPYSFTQQTGPGRAVFWANEIGVFALDQIQLRPSLQMSLGIRYDWQTYFDSPHNFSPRFSIAYAPGNQRRSVLRAGGGVFYDRAGARPISELKRFNGTVLRAITILDPNYANPIPPGQSIETLLPTGPRDHRTHRQHPSADLLQCRSGSSAGKGYLGRIHLSRKSGRQHVPFRGCKRSSWACLPLPAKLSLRCCATNSNEGKTGI